MEIIIFGEFENEPINLIIYNNQKPLFFSDSFFAASASFFSSAFTFLFLFLSLSVFNEDLFSFLSLNSF